MASTTNFGWTTPDDTDYVKDGAAAIRTLGSAIDTSLVDLKGGTTGQVLSKTSNTDMDFTWVAQDDSNAIQNAIVDAKGDLITATADDTPARLAVGNNGETLVADSAESVGLRWQINQSAGKNKIINGAFDIWQRGTSFSSPSSGAYLADRFFLLFNGTGATRTITRESFTPGSAPVAGYESAYFLRYERSVAGTGATADRITQRIEDVRTFAGQTVTVSFWAKVDSGTPSLVVRANQGFGAGGSADASVDGTVTLSTSWTRYSVTLAIPSISGKTIGSNTNTLEIQFRTAVNTVQTLDLWGVQVEPGSVATAFQTASGSIQGELALCQRYLPAIAGQYNQIWGIAFSTTGTAVTVKLPQTARVKPTGITVSAVGDFTLRNSGFTSGTPTAIAFNQSGTDFATLTITTTAGSPTIVKNDPVQFEWSGANSSILFTGCEL